MVRRILLVSGCLLGALMVVGGTATSAGADSSGVAVDVGNVGLKAAAAGSWTASVPVTNVTAAPAAGDGERGRLHGHQPGQDAAAQRGPDAGVDHPGLVQDRAQRQPDARDPGGHDRRLPARYRARQRRAAPRVGRHPHVPDRRVPAEPPGRRRRTRVGGVRRPRGRPVRRPRAGVGRHVQLRRQLGHHAHQRRRAADRAVRLVGHPHRCAGERTPGSADGDAGGRRHRRRAGCGRRHPGQDHHRHQR